MNLELTRTPNAMTFGNEVFELVPFYLRIARGFSIEGARFFGRFFSSRIGLVSTKCARKNYEVCRFVCVDEWSKLVSVVY